ncbi:hypothetical protein GCM10011490_19830 [Pseudoclavibacter endophyticus]|nr:hypothetical protein GCM10011490_19830 [Pseudoclavibacter endophyticus]
MDLMWSEERFVFAGADTTATIASSTSGGVTWGLRLRPGAAHALLGIPARELRDQRFDLSELIAIPSTVIDGAHLGPAVNSRPECRERRRPTAPPPADAVAVTADLNRLEDGQQADGGWHVDFTSSSPAASLEWRGYATVSALATLRANGRAGSPPAVPS